MQRRDAVRLIGLGVAGLATPARADAASANRQSTSFGGESLQLLTRPIPSSGEALPVIGVGTWQTFDVGASAAERKPLSDVLARFVEQGGRVIDSSPMYGRSERVVGDLTAQLQVRSNLFVATKVWTTGRQAGIDQMRASMRALQVEKVDLMQVHNLVDVRTHLDTLRGWKQDGLLRYIGVTHYTASSLDEVARQVSSGGLDFVQINYSVGERDAERRLLPLAADRGVAVIANRPFAGGDLFRKVQRKPLPPFASEIGCVTWAQLMLKFVVSHSAITCAIPGTSKVEHLDDNLGAAKGAQPDTGLRERIAAVATA